MTLSTKYFTALPTTDESQHFDRKSLRKVTGPTADFSQLARDCVCFANSTGGTLLIGIEDSHEVPPIDQRIDPSPA
jgi:ATP-dependent DNA helicase RecG